MIQNALFGVSPLSVDLFHFRVMLNKLLPSKALCWVAVRDAYPPPPPPNPSLTASEKVA